MIPIEPRPIFAGKRYRGMKSHREIGSPLENATWIDCDLQHVDLDSASIYSSVFSRCYFEKTSFYGCSAFRTQFLECKFIDCDLRGDFDEAVFLRCGFERCLVGDNNLGGITMWEDALSEECVVAGDPLPIVASTR